MRAIANTLRSLHFWWIALIFAGLGAILYMPILSFLDAPGAFSRAGFTSYTIQNILFLIPVIYANYIFKLKGGLASLIVSGIMVIPKALFLSDNPIASLLVSAGVIVTGSVITLSFYLYSHNMALQERSRNRLSGLIDALPVPIFAVDKSHKVTQWNTALESLTGIKGENVIGSDKHWKAFYSDERPVMADLIADGVPEDEIEANYPGISVKSKLIKGAFEAENFFPALGSKGKWLYFTASPILNSRGENAGAVETLADITDRKNVEKALKESEKSYKNIFESAVDAICIHDVTGNILAVNEATAMLSGYSREELLNLNVRSLIPDGSMAVALEVRSSILNHKPVVMPYELMLMKKDGTQATCMITSNLIYIGDGTPSFQNMIRDVTEEKRLYDNLQYYLEQITRAQEEERKRIARELHDGTLQTLIALLHQLEYILDVANLPIKTAKKLWGFHEQIRSVVQEVRRFSRDLRPAILDDLGLLPALEWVVQELKQNYHIESTLAISGMPRRLLPEAELLLFRIVQEAVSNISKHSQATKADINIEFAGNKVSVVISDNGKGFTVPERSGGLIGSGKLGLAGLQERAQLLGGKMTIDSQPGKGTRVTVEAHIPLTIEEELPVEPGIATDG